MQEKIQLRNPYPEKKSWWETGYSRAVEVRQKSLTSISTSESVCGLSVVHPLWRSDAVWECWADAGLWLPTAMRACGGASAHSNSQWGMVLLLPLYIAPLSRRRLPLKKNPLKVIQERNHVQMGKTVVFLALLSYYWPILFTGLRVSTHGRASSVVHDCDLEHSLLFLVFIVF